MQRADKIGLFYRAVQKIKIAETVDEMLQDVIHWPAD